MDGRRRRKPNAEQERERKPRRERSPDEERDALLGYAFRALGAKALTEAELRTRLARRSPDPELIEVIVRRVQELGYQSDEHVARTEGGRRSVGVHRVRQNLKTRGIAADLIAETLDARDTAAELESATELLARRWGAFSRKRDPKSSAYGFLARRGFPGAVIWSAIAAQPDVHELDPELEIPDFDDAP